MAEQESYSTRRRIASYFMSRRRHLPPVISSISRARPGATAGASADRVPARFQNHPRLPVAGWIRLRWRWWHWTMPNRNESGRKDGPDERGSGSGTICVPSADTDPVPSGTILTVRRIKRHQRHVSPRRCVQRIREKYGHWLVAGGVGRLEGHNKAARIIVGTFGFTFPASDQLEPVWAARRKWVGLRAVRQRKRGLRVPGEARPGDGSERGRVSDRSHGSCLHLKRFERCRPRPANGPERETVARLSRQPIRCKPGRRPRVYRPGNGRSAGVTDQLEAQRTARAD